MSITRESCFKQMLYFFTDSDMISVNDGYKYLFTCIDCFSKMAWVFPLRKKTCDAVMTCFQIILSICCKKPERLNSDRGSELICKKFENFLQKEKYFIISPTAVFNQSFSPPPGSFL